MEAVPGNLRKLLSVAVRSIQWSYAIFWSLSRTQQGVLEWGDGYYNGHTKKRKTYQAREVFKANKRGLERSKRLRELYETLSESDHNSHDEHDISPDQTSLSLEDLSDVEWFYMICMSFVFRPGQGLPGRALAFDQSIWLCNAQNATRRVFCRSLLAKSASVQTVLCFPYRGGVLELGTTELVLENNTLIPRIKTILLDFSKPNCYMKYTSASYSTDDDDEHPTWVNAENDNGKIKILQNAEDVIAEDQEMSLDGPIKDSEDDSDIGSPNQCSFTSEQSHQLAYAEGSMNSSNSVSKVLARSTEEITKPKSGAANNETDPLENGYSADLHYKRVISTILGKSNLLTGSLGFSSRVRKSSFGIWKNLRKSTNSGPLEKQKILKKMMFAVPLMYGHRVIKTEVEHIENNVISKRQERDEKLLKLENKRFSTLRSMIPSAGTDKALVLEDTIKYVQELEARLGELKSNIKIIVPKKESIKVPSNDTIKQTSEDTERKSFQLKRKACEESELNNSLNVQIVEEEVLIEISCTWRDYLLLDIMWSLPHVHSVQSSTQDGGAFTLRVDSKFRGVVAMSARVLMQTIWESICQ